MIFVLFMADGTDIIDEYIAVWIGHIILGCPILEEFVRGCVAKCDTIIDCHGRQPILYNFDYLIFPGADGKDIAGIPDLIALDHDAPVSYDRIDHFFRV